MEKLPFIQLQIDKYNYHRTFYNHSGEEEFVWHRDEEDRLVICEQSTDWMIQLEDDFPVPLSNSRIYIPSETWHRLIKGTGDLEVQIQINNKDE